MTLSLVKTFTDEWFLLKFLQDWTGDDINLAIDRDIDLQELIVGHPDEASPIATISRGYDPEGWSIKEVLGWFKDRRPDMYETIIENVKGVNWVKKHWVKRMGIKKTLSST